MSRKKDLSKVCLFRVHALDPVARSAVQHILNRNHEKRFKQSVLDFYRNGCGMFLNETPEHDIVFVVGTIDTEPVGFSCVAVDSEICASSITVVARQHRNIGIGTHLLGSKVAYLRRFHPTAACKMFVNETNNHALAMCASAGLFNVGRGSRKLESGDKSYYSIFSTIPKENKLEVSKRKS